MRGRPAETCRRENVTGRSRHVFPPSRCASPAYNRAGNMTTIPKLAMPTGSYAGSFDAWGRLVSLTDGGTTVASYDFAKGVSK